MPNQLPVLPNIAAAALAVGLLFCARFALGLRRLRKEVGPVPATDDPWGMRTSNRFGAEREPERRRALRQGAVGLVFLIVAALLYLAVALAAAGWLPASGRLS